MVTKKCMNSNKIVGGGGAIEMAVSTALQKYVCSLGGDLEQLFFDDQWQIADGHSGLCQCTGSDSPPVV